MIDDSFDCEYCNDVPGEVRVVEAAAVDEFQWACNKDYRQKKELFPGNSYCLSPFLVRQLSLSRGTVRVLCVVYLLLLLSCSIMSLVLLWEREG
jgi:hypothetical protein